jgi:hypothetical protein
MNVNKIRTNQFTLSDGMAGDTELSEQLFAFTLLKDRDPTKDLPRNQQ